MPVSRCWCLFEIALDQSDVKLTINFPSGELSDLKSGVTKGPGCIIDALSDIQAEKAKAKSESDREMIFEVIRKSAGGFSHFNQKVKDGLRSW